MNRAHGKHVYVDYVGFQSNQSSTDGRWILKILQNAVNKCGIRQVHSHVEIFDGEHSPPGFAAVVLIDESHVTAHCYSDLGWLAIDAFTCGGHDPENIMDIIHESLTLSSPNIIQMRRDTVNRFIHPQTSTEEENDPN